MEQQKTLRSNFTAYCQDNQQKALDGQPWAQETLVQSQTGLQTTKASNSKANVDNNFIRNKGDTTKHGASNETYAQEANWQATNNIGAFSIYVNRNSKFQEHSNNNWRLLH